METVWNAFPQPSASQLSWHALEYYGFIHFTTNTFTDREWGHGDEDPRIFQPTDFDADQWADTARNAGMKGLILTCKHHDGFCLWPSRYTEHSVKHSPWRHGKGDIVREVSEACERHDLKFGVYLSPWDRNHAEYGRSAYVDYYRRQLQELLTEYGPVFEVWFDGANGGDGFYGGSRETRRIDPAGYYGWQQTWELVRRLQPNALCFSDAGPDIRWVGNEAGTASETTWYTLDTKGRFPGYNPPSYDAFHDLGTGHIKGQQWVPPEVDVSIRPGWFYHRAEDTQVKGPQDLLDIYFRSVGRGTNLLLNLPPDRRGLIHENDREALMGFRKLRDSFYAAAAAGRVQPIADKDLCGLELQFDQPQSINYLTVQEDIAEGQRARRWHVDAWVDGHWCRAAEATSMGWKRILNFSATRTDRLRLVVDESDGRPLLRSLSAHSFDV